MGARTASVDPARRDVMKVGFIGTGRMGQAMVRRLLDARHDVGVYNRTPEKAEAAGRKPAPRSSARSPTPRATAMRSSPCSPTTTRSRRRQAEGGLDRIAAERRHPYLRRHPRHRGHPQARRRTRRAGQILIAAPMLGRPELVASGQAGVVVAGPAQSVAQCKPLFDAIGRRAFEGGDDPKPRRRSRSPTTSCSAAPSRRWAKAFALIRKYGVVPDVFYDVMTDGLFNCSAYKVYGKIIVDESYCQVGQMAMLGPEGRQSRARGRRRCRRAAAERQRLARPSGRRGRARRRRQGLGGDGAGTGARQRTDVSSCARCALALPKTRRLRYSFVPKEFSFNRIFRPTIRTNRWPAPCSRRSRCVD